MRKTVKVGFILLVLGVLLAIFGIANQGLQTVYWANHRFRIAHQTTQTYHPKTIKSLTLATNLKVTVKSGNTATIKVTTNAIAAKKPRVTIKNGQVIIKSKVPEDISMVGFNLQPLATPRIVITVPRQTHLTKLTTTTDQGAVQLNDLTIKQLTLNNYGATRLRNVTTTKPLVAKPTSRLQLTNVTASSLKLTNSDARTAIANSHFQQQQSSLTTVSGAITISQTTFKQAQIKSGTGNITLSANQVQNKLTVTNRHGQVKAKVPRNTGIQATSTSGSLHIFNWHGHHHYRYRPNATSQYQLTTDTGRIAVSAN